MSYQCPDSTLQIGILLMPNPVKGRVAENLAVGRARSDRLATDWPWPARGVWSGCRRRSESGEIAVENADKFTVQFAKEKESEFVLEIIMEKS
jgi:hypothetical protein